ncbi:MAG: peptidoglycan binding protein CsiV [Gammaproteobacteria bacterium]|nr:peptidoglycan binding protein CsiV [Gammaproteobacteria bacterium]
MRKPILHYLLLLLTLTAGGTALGEEPGRQFDIEVVIFSHINAYDGGEAWPQEEGHGVSPGTGDTLPLDEVTTALPNSLEQDANWQALPGDARKLTAVAEALRRSNNYRPLAHLHWRQTLMEPAAAQSIDIASLGGARDDRTNPRLEGSLRLSVARYLHLETDLRLVEDVRYMPQDNQAAVYSLRQSRRMRSGELHYIDHPRLGVLALVTPATEGN